jgi:hypothetical protein
VDDSDSLRESLEIDAGLALRLLEWRFHLKPERGRYGEEEESQKSEEEKEVEFTSARAEILPGPNAFWSQRRS